MGRELVLQLLQRGARVAAVDRNPAALSGTTDAAGAASRACPPTSWTSPTAPRSRRFPAEVIAAHGAVDGLINNAGIIQPFVPVAELDDATIERVLDVNLMGTLHMVRAFLPRPAVPTRGAPGQRVQHGRLLPVPGPDAVRREQGGGPAADRGVCTPSCSTPTYASR